MINNCLLAVMLLFSVSAFAQELNNWQKQKLEKEMAEITEVMGLSGKQVKKVEKIKIAQAHDAARIGKEVTKGTPEASATWKEHGGKFNEQIKSVVSDEQWKKWVNRNKKATSKPKATGANTIEQFKAKGLNDWQAKKGAEDLAKMTKVMDITEAQ